MDGHGAALVGVRCAAAAVGDDTRCEETVDSEPVSGEDAVVPADCSGGKGKAEDGGSDCLEASDMEYESGSDSPADHCSDVLMAEEG